MSTERGEDEDFPPADEKLSGKVVLEYILYEMPVNVNFRKHTGFIGAAARVLARKLGEVDSHGMPTRGAVDVAHKICDRAYGLPTQQIHHTADGVDIAAMIAKNEKDKSKLPPNSSLNDILRIEPTKDVPPDVGPTAAS